MRRFPCVVLLPSLAFGLFLLLQPSLNAQQELRNQGGLDSDLSSPKLSQRLAQSQDATALAELQAYANVTGLGAWSGMQASGTTTYADTSAPLATTLNMLPGNRTRLVVTSSKGDSVTATNGIYGHVQDAGGGLSALPALTIAAGIVPFDFPALVSQYPSSFTILEGGTATIDGTPFHKITVEMDISQIDGGNPFERRAAIDLYFDPASHLLKKSAMTVQVPGAGRHRFLRVVTYAGYTSSRTLRVPTSISETLDGRATWSLQLSSVNTTTPPANTIF